MPRHLPMPSGVTDASHIFGSRRRGSMGPRTLDDPFGVVAPKSLCNMATPANRVRRGEDLGKLFGGNFVPLDGRLIKEPQSCLMIQVLDRSDGTATECAGLAGIPLSSDRPQAMAFGIAGNLAQALLGTVLLLRPAIAGTKLNFRTADHEGRGGADCGDLDGRSFMVLRASD